MIYCGYSRCWEPEMPHPKYRQLLNDHAESILHMVKEKLVGETDKATINAVIEKMERIPNGYFNTKGMIGSKGSLKR